VRRGIRAALLALGCAFAAATSACHEPEPTAVFATRPEAVLHIEPSRLRAGDVVEIRISLRTPPGHHLAPWQPPEPEGTWLLDTETMEVRRDPGQWLHDVRVRLRARDLGVIHWPDSTLVVVDDEDHEIEVPLAGRDFEVVAPPPVLAERDGPYGMLRAAPDPSGVGWLAVVAGAAAGALAALLLPWAWRRWPPRPVSAAGADAGPASAGPDLFEWAFEELDSARTVLDREPIEAARRTARTLRAFVARRFEATVTSRTTPELEAEDPPFKARSRWPWFLRVLRDLDDLRFRTASGEGASAEAGRRAAMAVEETRRFVEEARPGRRPS
jgi:hypothetical protein